MLITMLPLPEAPRTPVEGFPLKIALDPAPTSPTDQPGRKKRRGLSLITTTLQAVSNVPLVSPLSAGCREKCVIGSPRAHFSAGASNRCDSGQNKAHAFSKREQISSSAYHKRPNLMQPVFRAVSTSCHAGRDLTGHPRCVRVGNGYDKTRLYTPIRLKTTAVCSPPQYTARTLKWCRVDESAGKRSHRNRSSSPERVRLLQPQLPRTHKRWWPATYSRSQICPGDCFMSLDLKDAYITDDSWDSHLKGWCINTRSSHLGCPCLPALLRDTWIRSATDGNSHPQQPRWLGHSVSSSHKTVLLSQLCCSN